MLKARSGASRRSAIPRSNLLLQALSGASPERFAALEIDLKPKVFDPGRLLSAQGQTPSTVYFVDAGLVSVVCNLPHGGSIHIGAVGVDGVTSVGWLLGGASPAFSHVAVSPVKCRALDWTAARRMLDARGGGPLDRLLGAHAQQMMGQFAQSVGCARFHTASERLARMLLLISSRLDSAVISLTHESLAAMVGAPRSLVTESLGQLKRTGCIEGNRGCIAIRSPEVLEHQACECFEIEQERLFAFMRQVRTGGP